MLLEECIRNFIIFECEQIRHQEEELNFDRNFINVEMTKLSLP